MLPKIPAMSVTAETSQPEMSRSKTQALEKQLFKLVTAEGSVQPEMSALNSLAYEKVW